MSVDCKTGDLSTHTLLAFLQGFKYRTECFVGKEAIEIACLCHASQGSSSDDREDY